MSQKNNSKLINFSSVSTKLTGNRTQITRMYDQKKYLADFKYLIDFESDWEKGIYTHNFFLSESGAFVNIKLDTETKKILYLYVCVGIKIFTEKDFEIQWNGLAIQKIEINFNTHILKLL